MWGAKLDHVDKWKHSAARYCAGGTFSAVKLLVERGADVRLKNDNGQTASDLARRKGEDRFGRLAGLGKPWVASVNCS
jgi:ankyrin repeat protein